MPQNLPRRFMHASLSHREARGVPGLRAPSDLDVPGLGMLMHRAYLGTVDDHGETVDQAIEEVRKTFGGAYGAFMPACSAVVAGHAALWSATLITRWEDVPFVAFAMTDPAAKRHGLARACLIHAMNRLLEGGESRLRLVVTLANEPARALYESLGFVFE